MSARSLWLWLHGTADVASVSALAGAAVPAAPLPAVNPAARETAADAPAGEEFKPGVWARAAIGIYS
ncbi:MAG TPA: hypothetical protein VF092_24360 [Longimicrobium sp.]